MTFLFIQQLNDWMLDSGYISTDDSFKLYLDEKQNDINERCYDWLSQNTFAMQNDVEIANNQP